METLLLTGTIAPHQDIGKIGYNSGSLDPKKRWKEYFSVLNFYICESKFDVIIFCENSNYPIQKDWIKLECLAKDNNKKLELLQYTGDHHKTLEKGYGYGEGECIDYAVSNSKLLNITKYRYKVTGRYYIDNINKVIDEYKTSDNLFIQAFGISLSVFAVCTAFFKTNTEFYKKYLYGQGDKVDYRYRYGLENIYYDILSPLFFTKTIKQKVSILPQIRHLKKRDIKERIFHIFNLHNFGFFSKILDKLIYKKRIKKKIRILS